MKPETTAQTRTPRVPLGSRVVSGRVPCHRIRIGGTAPVDVGETIAAMQLRLRVRDGDPWPAPFGCWEEDPAGGQTFVLLDGAPAFVGALMAGWREILVAWVEEER